MKRLFTILSVLVVMLGVSACGNKNYTTTDMIDEETAKSEGFIQLGDQPDSEGRVIYLSPDSSVGVFFKDGQFYSAYLTQGTSVQVIAKDGELYLADNDAKQLINDNGCFIDGTKYEKDSQECQSISLVQGNVNDFIKENFKSIVK